MTTPQLDDRIIVVDGKEYRAKPVMLVFYYMEDIGDKDAAHKIHDAMTAGMHFYHTEAEIFELMAKLTLPQVVEFLSVKSDEEELGDEPNFPAEESGILTDRYLIEGPGEKELPSPESSSESAKPSSGRRRSNSGRRSAGNT